MRSCYNGTHVFEFDFSVQELKFEWKITFPNGSISGQHYESNDVWYYPVTYCEGSSYTCEYLPCRSILELSFLYDPSFGTC